MDFVIYSIYDRVSGQYGEPWISQNDATAVRKFNYLMQNSPMVNSDCELYKVGAFNSDKGELGLNFSGKPDFVCKYEVKVSE